MSLGVSRPKETTIEFSCDAGQTLTFPGSRVDYLFSFNNVPSAVGALALNDLQVSDAVTLEYVAVGAPPECSRCSGTECRSHHAPCRPFVSCCDAHQPR